MSERVHVTTEAHETSTEKLTPHAVTGGDVLVEVMRAAGVDVAFGVISIHNLPLVEAVDRKLRFVPVRHEAAAVNAADGYARATGGIGVALTSTGTGAGNAAGSMLEAMAASSRVLHITGNINADLIGEGTGAYHEVPRQLQMLKAVSAHALRIETPRQARAVLTEAARLARTAPTGPVSVDWPIDLQYLAKPDQQNKVDEREPALRTGARRDLERAAAVMRPARRPLIWAGGGAREASAEVVALAEAWGAGVLTGSNGRGTVPEDHALLIGNFPADEDVEPILREANCLLTIGSHLRGNETRNYELPLPQQHVRGEQIHGALLGLARLLNIAQHAIPSVVEDDDHHGWRLGREHRELALVDGQAAIADDGQHRVVRAADSRTDRLRQALTDAAAGGEDVVPRVIDVEQSVAPGAPRDRHIPDEDRSPRQATPHGVADLGIRADVLAVGGADRLRDLAHAAGPVAIGLRLAEQLRQRGYGRARIRLQPHGHREVLADHVRVEVDLHFGLLAKSVGLKHRRVRSAEDFDTALKKALKRGGPSLIEVDVAALRPKPAKMVPPIEVPSTE